MNELLQKELRKLLAAYHAKRVAKNPRYTSCAFARSLGIGSAAYSEIMRGKRRVSAKYAAKLLVRLGASPLETRRVMRYATFLNLSEESDVTTKTQLNMDEFHLISSWYHLAIVALTETMDFDGTEESIARRLGLTQRETREAVATLVRLNILAIEGGRILSTNQSYRTSDGIQSSWLRKSHAETLEQAAISLENEPVDRRYFTSSTVAIDPALLPDLAVMIRQFLDHASAFGQSTEKKQVYRLAVQLFPLSDRGAPQ